MIAVKLLFAVVLCQGAGFVGSIFTVPSIPVWYATISKPFFTPPDWLFAPVWTLLYLMMAVALFIVWLHNDKKEAVNKATVWFMIQLFFNVAWSIAFFYFQSPFLALIIIFALMASIIITTINFLRISKWSGLLLFPYIAWVSFASVLNLAIWWLNR